VFFAQLADFLRANACGERRGRMRRFRCEAKCLDGPAPFVHLNVYGNRIWSSGTLPSSFATASGLHAAREFSFQTNCTKVNIIMSRGRHTARHSSAAARQRNLKPGVPRIWKP
jgi:hypothetical protein